MRVVEVRPEKGQQALAAVKPARIADREVYEEGEALRLRQNAADLPSIGSTQVDPAQGAQEDGSHARMDTGESDRKWSGPDQTEIRPSSTIAV